MRRLIIPVLASLLLTTATNAQTQETAMKDSKPTKTICLGRFLVDVPKDASTTGDTSEYRSRKVSQERMGKETFRGMMSEKEQFLKDTKHEKEPSLLKELVTSSDGDAATFVFRESSTGAYQYKVQAFKWVNGKVFTLDSRVDDDRIAKALALSAKTLSELQSRRDNEIPKTPGFCIDGGFFAGEPGWPHLEGNEIVFRLRNHPDVVISMYTDMNGEKVGESLLARIDRKSKESAVAELFQKFKTLRRGNHPVGAIQAEEILQSIPTGETFSTHEFTWEADGKPRDIYAPTIVVNIKTGRTEQYSYIQPSVTDQQAIDLFDSIVNSIRLRPTGETAEPAKPVPPPAAQSKVPLGTTLASGQRCPQTGMWLCDRPDAIGGARRFIRDGETLSGVLVPVERSLLTKLKGAPLNRETTAMWTLERLSPTDAG